MFQKVLNEVLKRAELSPEAIFTADEVAQWPEGAVERFVSVGFLKETSYARSIECDGCEQACIEEVEFVGECAYVICHQRDDIGRVPVPLDRLYKWKVDMPVLAQKIAIELGIRSSIKEVESDRLWSLGSFQIKQCRVDIFLARGINWADATKVFLQSEQIGDCSTPIVLVLMQIGKNKPFPPMAKLISLQRVSSVVDDNLILDLKEIEQVVSKGRISRIQNPIPFRTKPGTSWYHIVIEFVNREVVKIIVGGESDHRSFSDMGFVDRRTSRELPDQRWIFFRKLAETGGNIGWDNQNITNRERNNMKRLVSDTRKRLKVIFPDILDDPFESYRKVNAYQTKFTLRWGRNMREELTG